MCNALNQSLLSVKSSTTFSNFKKIFCIFSFFSFINLNRSVWTDPAKVGYLALAWNKSKTLYYINNWVYTTNHKRIAVNYFWFVILSGIIGMVLATIIRLELAYPGVGIFAGDSLQYLSMVTAHGVIMVFFMIMPLLFGAFGNFLLPTQLGVHDVAFPRLNSAAFWFLPAGLIMLGQLVCIDRRYQRMNCFNIREVQSLLKRKFFTDLINTHDYKNLIDKSIIGVKYRTNQNSYQISNTQIFFNFGLENAYKGRNSSYFAEKTFLKTSNIVFESFQKKLKNLHFIENLSKYYIYTFTIFFKKNQYFILNTGLMTNVSFFFIKLVDLKNQTYTAIENVFLNFITNFFMLSNNNFDFLPNPFNNDIKKFNIIVEKNLFLEHYYVLLSFITTNFKTFFNFFLPFYEAIDIKHCELFGLPILYIKIYTAYLTGNWIDKAYLYSFFVFLFSKLQELKVYSVSVLATPFLYPISSVSYIFQNDKLLSFLSRYLKLVQTLDFNFFFYFKNFIFMEFFKPFFCIGTFTHITIFFLNFQNSTNKAFIKFTCLITHMFPTANGFFKNPQFYSESFANSNLENLTKFSNLEISLQNRNRRFDNPIFKYDYKAGNYFPKMYKEAYTYLFSTLSDITNALKPSVWFFSIVFKNDFTLNIKMFQEASSNLLGNKNLLRESNWFFSSDGFYNFFYSLNSENLFLNQRWLALNVLNQKFHRMFTSSSMQQRIYSNWRQLKFSREAWRCKLLAARHQKTLYRRYVNEDGVFWSIERNAKDLLPGWAMITPFSSRTRFTAIGKVDIGLMGVFLVLNSSIISGANFLVTYRYLSTLNNRKMRDARAFFAEGVMVASWMMIAANPMLVIGIIMLLSDRHWQTSFFDYSGGGDTILFQHMFWFFGHPEVYVILIPVFGFTNTILSYYLRKRVSARASLLYSMYTIAFLGFFVWGHHMYMVGLAHTTRMLFSTLTVMISVPAATKLMHWCVTLVNSSFTMELPFLFVLTFIFFFVSGGISGMFVAHTGMDILFHDTFYVIGHFHVMLAGAAMFGSFGAFYFYFPAIFGVKYSRIYAYLHYTYYLIGQLMTVIPMFWLGYAGMPRRVLDYPASMGGWHSVISAGHLLSVAGLLAFFIMIFDSLRQGRAVLRNTFGINRYNTRLNFYLYEIARLTHIHQKTLYLLKFLNVDSLKLNKLNYTNFEPLESTLMYYNFVKK